MKLRNKSLIGELRKFYVNEWTNGQVRQYLSDHHDLVVSIRTLQRWKRLSSNAAWQGPQCPKPPIPPTKVTPEILSRICALREKTGWGRSILKEVFPFDLSESTYRDIIKERGLSRGSKIENKRIHWVKWQRQHPDSLWQLDATQESDGTWILHIIDDCSRFSPGIARFQTMTTDGVIAYMESLFAIHGKPRELLTDNGSEFGGTSKNSQFDDWCRRQEIIHIRSRVHKPTTCGKVERYHLTMQQEIAYCHNDLELFRYRYNHIRPHSSLGMRTPASVYFDLQQRLKTTKEQPQQKWG